MVYVSQFNSDIRENTVPFYFLDSRIIGGKRYNITPLSEQCNQACNICICGSSINNIVEAMYRIVITGMVTGISEKWESFQELYDIPNIIKLYHTYNNIQQDILNAYYSPGWNHQEKNMIANT